MRIVLFACLLLLVTPLHLHAQSDPRWTEFTQNRGWLTVHIDPHGGANVALQLPVDVRDRQQLKRSLAESFSFPVVFDDGLIDPTDSDEEFDTDERGPGNFRWTTITARGRKAFSGTLESTCDIDLQRLLPQLQAHHIDYLKVWVIFQNANRNVAIKGAERLSLYGGHLEVDRYETDIDTHGTVPAIHFAMGYSSRDVFKSTLPVILFMLLPALLTNLNARRLSNRPAELWGRHLRFLHRLLNVTWLAWLPVSFMCGAGEIISFSFGNLVAVGHVVTVAFYFGPPVVAMFLCHFASRRVYEQVPAADWSPREVVRHAIIVSALRVTPMLLVVFGVSTLSSSPRQSALLIVVGYVGFIVLSQNAMRLFGTRLHALTSGDLRNRLFELAQRAEVQLRQVYVLPETRAQLSNAFARGDNSVMITNSLLKNLSRREVDAIMAHEIGHLQAKHPQSVSKITIGVIVVANTVGTMITLFSGLRQAAPLVFTAALALAYLVVFFCSRRNEQQADEIGIRLTGDPEAFISGLARLSRLNLVPLHSGGWGESLDTHPGTMQRFQRVAKAHGLSESRLHELVADSALAPDRYPSVDGEVSTRIFSSEFKKTYRVRVALALLAVLLLAPVPFAFFLGLNVSFAAAAGIAVAGFVWSFGAYHVVRNRIAYWGYHSLSRRLKMKLEKRGLVEAARNGVVVGLAPAAESRKYEGYMFWDAGVLWLTQDKLYYIGEQCEFALDREQVTEVYACDTNPEWLSEKSLYLSWKDYPQATGKTLYFVAAGEGSLLKARRVIESLQKRLRAWMYQTEDFPVASAGVESMALPVFPEITSAPALTRFKPESVFKAAFHLSLCAAVISFAIQMTYLAILYMAAVAFLGTLLDELPKAFKRRRIAGVIKSPRSFETENYKTGSWMDA